MLYYIAGTYISYFAGGMFVYWGIDKILANWWQRFVSAHGTLLFSLEIVLGFTIVVIGVVLFFKQRTKPHSVSSKEAKPPRSVHSAFLFFFGASNTVGDLSTAFPYLIFIAKTIEARLSVLPVAWMLLIYCFIYIFPLIVVHFLYIRNKNKLTLIVEALRKRIAPLIPWATDVFVFGVGILLIIHGCLKLSA